MAVSEYAKVSFITTKSGRIPSMLKHTGALIVMSDVSTGANGRHSLWLRGNLIGSGWGLSKQEYMQDCEWLAQSYNPIFSPKSGMAYFQPSKNLEDTPDIRYDDNGNIIGLPQSIHMLLCYGINYTDYTISYLSKNVDGKLDGLNSSIQEVKKDVGKLKNEVSYNLSYTFDEMNRVSQETYTYTKYWVNRIIGDAPEYLDSIKELNDWLKNNQDNALQTLGKMQELDKSKASLDKEDNNGFTYISDNQWYNEIDENTSLRGWSTYTYYDDSDMANPQIGVSYYTYHPSKVSYGGKISMKSSQISTDEKWHNIPLDKILERLVDKYPYKIPTVNSFTINGNIPEEWTNEVLEYGDYPKFSSLNVNMTMNDASSMNIQMIPSGSFITSTTSLDLSDGNNNITSSNIVNDYPTFDISGKQMIIDAIDKSTQIFKGYTVKYGKAILQEYPQLKGIDGDNKIIDPSGYDDGTFSGECNIMKKYNFKVYWGCGIFSPNNMADLQGKNNKFLEKSSTGKLETETNHDKIWVCLPSDLLEGNTRIVMKSWTSGIENDVTSINTDMIKKSVSATFMYKGLLNYSVVQIENLEFTMFADKVIIEVIFN